MLDDLTAAAASRFGISIEGRRLRATDLDWSYGSGTTLSGTAADLALAMCGRAVPAERLEGEPLLPADPAGA